MNMEKTSMPDDGHFAPYVAYNSAIQFFGKIISVGIGTVVVMILVRHLSVQDYGKYTLAFAFISFFSVFMDFGMMMIATREVSREPSKASGILGNLIVFRLAWSVVLMLAAVLAVYALRYPADLRILVVIASFTLLFSSFGILEVIFRINFKMKYSVIAGVCGSLISGISMILYLFFMKFSLAGLVAINTICTIIPGLLLFAFSGKFITLKFYIDINQLKGIFKESMPQGIATFLSAMYFNIDMILLSKLAGETSVAYYSTAYKILQIIILIPGMIMISVFPLLSKYSGEKEAFKQIYQKTFYYLMLIGIPLCAVIFIFSKEIIILLYSEKYLASAATLQMLACSGAVIFCSTLLGNGLVAINRQNMGIIIASIGLLLNVGLNFCLIPVYDFYGAAIATLFTELFVAILILIMIYFYEKILPFSRRLIKVFILSVLISALIIIFKRFNLIISIIAVIPFYVFFMHILKCYQEDFRFIEMARGFLKYRPDTGVTDNEK